jgi:hypothetical protein
MNPSVPADEQGGVCVFTQTLNAVRLPWERKECWWSRFPAPQSILHACPKIALAVLVQVEDCAPKTTVISKTLNTAVANRAEFSSGHCSCAGPYCSLTILEKFEDISSSEFRILDQLAVFPTRKTLRRTDPQSSIARNQQAEDPIGGKLLIGGWTPLHRSDAIETKQTQFCT